MVVLSAVCRHSTADCQPHCRIVRLPPACSSPHPSLFISFLYLFSANLSVSCCKARQFLALSTSFTCQYTLSTTTLFPLYCLNTSFSIYYTLRNGIFFLQSPPNIKSPGVEKVQETLLEAVKFHEAFRQSVIT